MVTLFRNRYRIETTRLADWDYRSRGWYFVTICTKDRRCSLGRIADGVVALSPAGIIAESEIGAISRHYTNVTVDCFAVMPNHVHAIIVVEGRHEYSAECPEDPKRDAASCVSTMGPVRGPLAGSLSAIVRGYKAGVARACRERGISDFAWQPRFHDHILGSNSAVNAVREYIGHNPENWQVDLDNPDRSRR